MTAFGVYLHVPFCNTRCGYCDFNTYTAADLGGGGSRVEYPDQAAAEIRMAAARLAGDGTPPRVSTVFVGGGTPTLLPAAELGRLLATIDAEFGLLPDAEVTTEANPDSVDLAYLTTLREAGFNRISFGMQSVHRHVLAVLERTHTPGRPQQCVAWAKEAGFEHVNLDLIYGTPGESDADWKDTLHAALSAGPDHVSAYSLIVESGTRLAAQVRRGDLLAPDPDAMADRYLMAEAELTAGGLHWYEVSNWAASPDAIARHNVLYWTGGNWWGVGPGAHSHVDGRRWWNVKHPRDYAAALREGRFPEADHEILTPEDQALENVMLRLRLREGLALDDLSDAGRAAARQAAADGLLLLDNERAVLTLRGRLLADAVIRDLTD